MAPKDRKRKREASISLPAKKITLPPPETTATTLKQFATNLKEDANKLSLLLDLPPELRNKVYEAVRKITKITLGTHARKHFLSSSSTLPRVNKQTRNEFLGDAMIRADIHIVSEDFDFRHIVTFLNTLPQDDLSVLPTLGTSSTRKIMVTINVASARHCDPTLLRRWLKRAGQKTKKGTDVEYKYRFKKWVKKSTSWPNRIAGRVWLATLSLGDRAEEEGERILKALKR